ncbi:MAG: M20/M25/M40 family metallo-hydrolase [Calditrichaeota bacterium]|nr:MAG: M20/M25/M40 family metallo-hydrolase [Calditrichota bacterium]
MSWKAISLAHDKLSQNAIEFCQKLIQTPSYPGKERNCAELILSKMGGLRFDKTEIDKAGNVLGFVKGTVPNSPKILLATHIDHVGFEDQEMWQFPPFEAIISGRKIFGRGAAEAKSAISAQIYGVAAILEAGFRPTNDIHLAFCVQEETGGTGMRYFVNKEENKIDLAIFGNATSNNIYLGHRGVANIELIFKGQSAHASNPNSGKNPHFPAAKFLTLLENEMPNFSEHYLLGKTIASPTLYEIGKTNINDIPSEVKINLNWRFSSETKEEILEIINKLTKQINFEINVQICKQKNITYNGFDEGTQEHFSTSFLTSSDLNFVQSSAKAIEQISGKKQNFGIWKSATDARFVAEKGIPTFGFGPGHESLVHQKDEFVEIEMLIEAMKCYSKFIYKN